VRERGGEAVLTVKQGAGRSRAEEEVRLEAEAFARLWPLTEGRRIEKVRHLVDDGAGHVIEVDVFDGALRGLVTAEVEFASDGDAEGFAAPAWLGREITDDPRFKNQRLALEGLPRR
jgi:CYTH domain-containing protein